MSSTKVIYTSLTKGYDNLLQPDIVRPDYDYICFSNDLGEADIGVWKIRKIPYANSSGTRLTRYPKLNPHLVLPEYETSIWVDANIVINEAMYLRADQLLSEGAICAMCAHSKRTSVYQEAEALLYQGFGEPLLVFLQAKYMLETGFSDPPRLPVCSLIFRKHLNQKVVEFSSVWWEQYTRFSCRDQMSVNYSLAHAGVELSEFLPSEAVAAITRKHQKGVHAAWRTAPFRFVVTLFPRAIRRIWREVLRARLRKLYVQHGLSPSGLPAKP